MVSKLPRYKLTFGYLCPVNNDKIIFGNLDERVFTYKDMEFFLKVMSPVNSSNWLQYIKCLTRGSDYILRFDEDTELGKTRKFLKITRN